MASAGNITAVLSLNATPFNKGLDSSISAVNRFVESVNKLSSTDAKTGISQLNEHLQNLKGTLEQVAEVNNSSLNTFSKLATAINKMANGLKTLSKDSIDAEQAVKTMDTIFKSFSGTLNGIEVKVKGVSTSIREMGNSTAQTISREKQLFNDMRNGLNALALSITRTGNVITDQEARAILKLQETTRQLQVMEGEFNKAKSDLMQFANTGVEAFNRIGRSVDSYVAKTNMLKLSNPYNNIFDSNDKVVKATEAVERNSIAMQRNGVEKLRNMGYTGQLDSTEQRLKAHTDQSTSSIQRQAGAYNTASASSNRLTTATSRLGKALSSLKMMGTMVGSMLAYNFAHHLAQATNETIQSKSEMEGYFKMLNYGQGDIERFNSALDQTVARFQRVNKYSLGETISSIGVEFNLTTEEMIKAMDVTSMITSEYLRAGRNANEASLAVKDVLQGQFQRLSRETGVKGEQLKEAGWNGDVTDVNSLLDALRKVGEDRNWDVFAEKANSLNDIVTILQNRFAEWSADMVNVVQPSIVGAFNAIMSVAQGFANILGGAWQWLNTDGWGQLAVKIGAVSSAFFVGVHALTAYRGGATLAQVANMGLTKSLGSLVLGLKAEDMVNRSLGQSLALRVAGTNAEKVAEVGLTNAINQAVFTKGLYKTTTEAQTLASGLREGVLVGEATAVNLVKDSETGAILLKQGMTIATNQNTTSTIGFTGALGMMIAGEQLAEGETLSLSGALGALTGAFLTSPIGWFTLAVLGLASAFYVATGGLDSMWGSLQNATKAVDDATSATKPYRDYVEKTNTELEEAKEKYGENSLVVQALSDKYDRAKDSLNAYYEKLQQATSQHGKLNEALDTTSAKMDEIMRERLGDTHSSSDIESFSSDVYDLELLQDHDYVALQKHEAMLGRYSDDIDAFAKVAGNDTQAIKDFNKTYAEFISYSDKANTADNWWDKTTNSFMAGVSGKSLEFQKWWKEFSADPFHTTFEDNITSAFDNIDWGALGDIGGRLSQWFSDIGTSLSDSWKDLTEMFDNNIKKPVTDWWNGFISFDWLFGAVSASDGSSDHPSFMEDVSSILGFDVQAWVDSFMADPLGTLGIDLGGFDIFGTLINYLFGIGDALDFSWATEWLNNNVITPISETWNNFMADPLSFIGGAVLGAGGIGGLLTLLLPSDGGVGIWEWVNNTIIQPMSQALWSGITSIPLVSDILALFGLVNGENSGSSQKGTDLGNAFKTAIENVIRNIPILSDILQMLGIIPQANPTASSNGKGVGDAIKQGFKNGITGIVDIIKGELDNIINAISNKVEEARQRASDLGNAIVQGAKNALDVNSPGIIAREIVGEEFGTYIPEAITSSGDLAYQSAQMYGQQITDGISSVNTDSLGLDTAVGNYETDAQMIATSSQMMGMTTTTAFNDMSLAVNNTTATMSSNVGTTYSQMQQKQSSSLQSMKTQNQTAYNEMYLKSNQSLIQMRDSTSNITQQMVSAWSHMKTQLVATANQLRSESTSHFNRLSETIGSFYRKIQNPSNWGAGGGSSIGVRGARNPTAGRSIVSSIRTRGATHHGAGGSSASPYTRGGKTMTLRALKNMICPDGSCDIFDGYDLSQKVDVDEFLSTIGGEHGFGWSGWNSRHFNYIKEKSDQWDMKSPRINLAGGIDTNTNFKVGDFENGTPEISFGSFQSMAEAIFTAIPYRFYYDSAWKGSWLGALQAGACNCSDGADALIAFANACGFSGYKQHGTWRNSNGQSFGHFWAVINGHKMDTTGWQNQRTWTPSNSAGSPMVRRASHSSMNTSDRPINVTININEPVYGVDELDSKIQDSVNKGLQREFNDPYTVELI